MNKTKIEWCDSTWNPVTGCLHGCHYCYARSISKRFGYVENLSEYEYKQLHVVEEKMNSPYPYIFQPTLHKYRLEEPKKKGKQQNIFVCSMSDLFGDWIPDEWINEVFSTCKEAPQHNYLFLTKNPKKYEKMVYNNKLLQSDNMWYGYTITNNKIPYLFLNDNHKTFLSIEPLHEKLNEPILAAIEYVNWVIIGAETGKNKTKIVPKKDWIDAIVNECKKHGIPVFMKDSLKSIMGKENMLYEFPKELKKR